MENKKSWGRTRREKKKKAIPSFPSIPGDTILEILSRLPIKSLVRFSCVSKQWRCLVSPITNKKIGRRMVLVESFNSSSDSPTFHSMDEEGDVQRVSRPWKKSSSHNLLGSCNGLLLLRMDDNDLFLWNPLTNFFKKVLTYPSLCNDRNRVVSGLCYDPFADEYMAVMALFRPLHGDKIVVVGSFKSQRWTRVDFPYEVYTVDSGPIVNGHLHWFVFKKKSDPYSFSPNQIVYFHSRMRVFKKVPMPQPNHPGGDIMLGLGALDGCLCMSRWENPIDLKGNVQVLVMKEYGVKESWTILFNLSDLMFELYDHLVPLGYQKNGEALMKVRHEFSHWHLRGFNPNDNSHRKIPTQPDCDYVDAIMYEESLISPTGYDGEEKERKGPVVNDHLPWFASRKTSGQYPFSSHQIVCFNSQICIFEKVGMPQPNHPHGDIMLGLGALDGCLCMSCSENPIDSKGNVEVLVMKKYDVKESWTILFNISDLNLKFYDTLVPLGYKKTSEALMKICYAFSHWHIRVFNPNDNWHRNIPLQPDCDYIDAIRKLDFTKVKQCKWIVSLYVSTKNIFLIFGNYPLHRTEISSTDLCNPLHTHTQRG